MKSRWYAAGSAMALLGALAPLGLAHAQTVPEEAPGLGNEIIVTARKREETLQKVPVAVSAFTGEGLRQKNITNIYDIAANVPGLAVRSGAAERGTVDFFIRGQGSTANSPPSVITYFGEAPAYTSLLGSDIEFYDIGSVQVLKGPQGTLFGRSATGGAVLLGPQRPTNKIEGYVTVRAGSYNMHELNGALNIPLIPDVLKMRFSGSVERRDGFFKNTNGFRDQDDRHREGYRLQLDFTPSPVFEDLFMFYGQHVNEGSTGMSLLEFNPNVPGTRYSTTPGSAGAATVAAICGATSPNPTALAAARQRASPGSMPCATHFWPKRHGLLLAAILPCGRAPPPRTNSVAVRPRS